MSDSADLLPSKILKHIYLGSQNHAKSKDILRKLNITHILNCTPPKTVDPEAGCPNFFEKENLFTYKRIPIFDNAGEDVLSRMASAIDFMDTAKHYGTVLVHCKKGISRSATFVIGYLMNKNEFSFQEAIEYVKSCRPIVNPNNAFVAQLQRYEDILTRENTLKQDVQESHTVMDITSGPSMNMAPMPPTLHNNNALFSEGNSSAPIVPNHSRPDLLYPVKSSSHEIVDDALPTEIERDSESLPAAHKSDNLCNQIHENDVEFAGKSTSAVIDEGCESENVQLTKKSRYF